MKFRLPPSFSSAFSEAAGIARDPRLLAWSLFVIFFPFYVLPNGLPQPAAWLLVGLMPSILFAWNGRINGETRKTLSALLWFVVYVVVANTIWSLVVLKFSIDLKDSFMLSPFFYIFNGLLFLTILLLHRRYRLRFIWLTTRVVFVSLVVQVLISFVIPGRLRAVGTFNEPNQLGYFGLLSACILLLGQRRTKMSTAMVSVGVMLCSYLALLSASKAALASIGLLAIAMLIGRLRTTIIAGLAFLVLILTPNPFSTALDRAQDRIENDRSLDFFEERGYDRILNHKEYWALGAGEGAYRRFADTTAIGSHELHSSLGTLFMSYGAVGTTLFVIFMWLIMRRTPFHTWLVVAPAFAYGMTHQGLRFSLFWVLLGFVVVLREAATPPPPARKPAVAR